MQSEKSSSNVTASPSQNNARLTSTTCTIKTTSLLPVGNTHEMEENCQQVQNSDKQVPFISNQNSHELGKRVHLENKDCSSEKAKV